MVPNTLWDLIRSYVDEPTSREQIGQVYDAVQSSINHEVTIRIVQNSLNLHLLVTTRYGAQIPVEEVIMACLVRTPDTSHNVKWIINLAEVIELQMSELLEGQNE